jgi:transposase
MKHKDMRSLPGPAQEERRRQVIGLRESGMTLQAIGQQVGLSRTGVFNICQRYEAAGLAGLGSQRPGPPVGTGRVLSAGQEAEIRSLIRRHTPDALGLPFALWSRPAVRMLIKERYGVSLSVRGTGRYLARWRFTAQKPLRRAYEQRPSEVKRWLKQEYPTIAARAKQEDGIILWGDETGLRSDDVRGRSYAPRGRTPVVRPSHKRAGVGLISAISNKGVPRWMVLEHAITAVTLIVFLSRLIRDVKQKVFLILDRLRVHRSAAVRDWLASRTDRIEVFHLPPYSPELNADEYLNADLKQGVGGKPPARGKDELRRNLVSHMRSLSRRPARVCAFFRHHSAQYAA